MIPQAIASTGPYADLWSHLKSMLHALDRAMNAKNARDLTELDRERLSALSRFLKTELISKSGNQPVSFGSVGLMASQDPSYSFSMDLQQVAKDLPDFEAYHASQKMGFDKKVQKLIAVLEECSAAPDALIPYNPPKPELRIIQNLLTELLVHAESALQG